MEPEHLKVEEPVSNTYVCSSVARFLPGRIRTKNLPVVFSNPSLSALRLADPRLNVGVLVPANRRNWIYILVGA